LGSGIVFLQAEALEALVEARELAAGVEQAAGAAGPRRMGPGIDVETNGIALGTIGAAGLETAPNRDGCLSSWPGSLLEAASYTCLTGEVQQAQGVGD
jgi:hypothetical protein